MLLQRQSDIQMKSCIRCGTIKEDSEFALRKFKSGNYGLRGACKECINKSNRSYRSNADRRAKYYETQKRWNTRNRNRVLELKKIERTKNHKRIRDYGAKYNKLLPDALVVKRLCEGSLRLRPCDIPKEVIEAKRMYLLIKRQLRGFKHA